jgi:chromosome segregation ATPase
MTTGYNQNKGGRELEQAQQKRMQDAQKLKKKRDLDTELSAKKSFLFSTKSMIDAKTPILKKEEVHERELKAQITILEAKAHELEVEIKRNLDKIHIDLEKRKSDLSVITQHETESKRQIDQFTADKLKLEREIKKIEADIMMVQR